MWASLVPKETGNGLVSSWPVCPSRPSDHHKLHSFPHTWITYPFPRETCLSPVRAVTYRVMSEDRGWFVTQQ